jgi:hypothetical protein
MNTARRTWRVVAASACLGGLVSACGGGTAVTTPAVAVAPPPVATTTPPAVSNEFSQFATATFEASADAAPVAVTAALVFDVNDDPTAFDALIASGAF